MATSYHHIWFSQNARGYTMIGFFALASTWLLLKAGETRRPRDYALYTLARAGRAPNRAVPAVRPRC